MTVPTPEVRPIEPSACTHCGIGKRNHFQLWTPEAGWHRYAPPTVEQIKARMVARREARQA